MPDCNCGSEDSESARFGHPHTKWCGGKGDELPSYLFCNTCNKCVSSGFNPVPVPGFKGIVVRAYIECPECVLKRNELKGTV